MLTSALPLRLPLVDHCCGICELKKAVGESTWCIMTTTCTGGCECADYTADCEFVDEMTGTNEGPADQYVTVLCTPCEEHFGDFDACGALCSGECLLEVVEKPDEPGECMFCVHERTCEWGGTRPPGPGELCDCKIDCQDANCDLLGITIVTPCEQKFPPTPPCALCGDI
jgi:hypothetical protein